MDVPQVVYLLIPLRTSRLFPLFSLLRIVLLLVFMNKFLLKHLFLILLGIYIGVELLDYMVILSLTF